jgi:hypothetical protein
MVFCSIPTASNAMTQTQIACQSVQNFPEDYGQVWPVAVKRHNQSSGTVSAASYMKNYIEIQKMAFKINEPIAVLIYKVYEHYWTTLEEDLIAGNGKIPANAISVKVLAPMMKNCDLHK